MNVSRFARAPIALALAALAGVAVLVTPLLSSAKGPSAPTEAAPSQQVAPADDAARQLQVEFLTIRQALAEAEQKALQDPALERSHTELQTAIEAEMRKADPTHDTKIARLGEIEQQLTAAQSAATPDTAALDALMNEARGIQEQLMATQDAVVQQEPIAARITTMREQMLAKMTEVDPKVPEHMQRLEALVQQLQ